MNRSSLLQLALLPVYHLRHKTLMSPIVKKMTLLSCPYNTLKKKFVVRLCNLYVKNFWRVAL